MLLATTPLTDFSTWLRSDGLEIVMLVSGAVLVSRVVTWLSHWEAARINQRVQASEALVRSEATKHRQAVTGVVTWAFLALLYFVVAILVLQRLGVPIATLLGPAAVAGVALGFGAQRVVQDVLAGFLIVTERQYGYGDTVRITATAAVVVIGTVEELTLRITRIRTINGEVVFVPNGQIILATNLSRDWARAVIDVPLPAASDVSAASSVLRKVGKEAFADESLRQLLLDEPSVMGVESISVDEIDIRVVARTLPGKQFEVSRTLRARISTALRQAGIAAGTVVAESEQ